MGEGGRFSVASRDSVWVGTRTIAHLAHFRFYFIIIFTPRSGDGGVRGVWVPPPFLSAMGESTGVRAEGNNNGDLILRRWDLVSWTLILPYLAFTKLPLLLLQAPPENSTLAVVVLGPRSHGALCPLGPAPGYGFPRGSAPFMCRAHVPTTSSWRASGFPGRCRRCRCESSPDLRVALSRGVRGDMSEGERLVVGEGFSCLSKVKYRELLTGRSNWRST